MDDFLFVDISRSGCNTLVRRFLDLCKDVSIPVSYEKTEWATDMLTFLGIFLDGQNLCLSIPLDKRNKAINLLNKVKDSKKVTVKQLQELTGYLNFLGKAIFPGRSFT